MELNLEQLRTELALHDELLEPPSGTVSPHYSTSVGGAGIDGASADTVNRATDPRDGLVGVDARLERIVDETRDSS
jgi:hypothetical protein